MGDHSPVKKLRPSDVAGCGYTAPKPRTGSSEWEEKYYHGRKMHLQNEQKTYERWMKNTYVECGHVEHVAYDGKRVLDCACTVCAGTATHVTHRNMNDKEE